MLLTEDLCHHQLVSQFLSKPLKGRANSKNGAVKAASDDVSLEESYRLMDLAGPHGVTTADEAWGGPGCK